MNHAAAIILAGGKSVRMEGTDKMNIDLGGISVRDKAVEAFRDIPEIEKIIVVGPEGDAPAGETRQGSVANGLSLIGDDIDFVLIHDGARPFVTKEVIQGVLDALKGGAAGAVPCVSPKDTIRTMSETLDRSSLYAVQTPQGFRADIIKDCFKKAFKEGFEGTDDASVAEHYGVKVVLTKGDYRNYKITTKEDVPRVPRFGSGYDLHKLVEGRPLMLGCIEVPFEKGLLGHSDADVIAHAVADAMLGAAALGDIGKLFPDNAKETEGMSGREILSKTAAHLEKHGFTVASVDATLVAQKPKVAPYTDSMRKAIASALGIDPGKVSVKATTEEGMGPTGEGLAMAAYATAVVLNI